MKKKIYSIHSFESLADLLKGKAVACLLLVVCALSACKKTSESPSSATVAKTVLEYIKQDKQLTLLNAVIIKTHLDTAFNNGGPYTVFAPSDSALTAAGWTTAKIQAANPDSLKLLFSYDIVKGKISGTDLVGLLSQKFTSLNPFSKPQITKNYYGIFFDGNKVIEQIQAVDGVLNRMSGAPLAPQGSLYETILKQPDLTFCAAILRRNLNIGFRGYLNQILKTSPDSLITPVGRPSFKNFTLLLPNDETLKAAGYTLDSLKNGDQDAIFNNVVSCWFLRGQYFESDFRFTGFIFFLTNSSTNYSLFYFGQLTYPLVNLGVQPDGKTLYYYTVPNFQDQSNNILITNIGQIIRPDIVANNGTIHIINTILK